MNSNYDLKNCIERADGSLVCMLRDGTLRILEARPLRRGDLSLEDTENLMKAVRQAAKEELKAQAREIAALRTEGDDK